MQCGLTVQYIRCAVQFRYVFIMYQYIIWTHHEITEKMKAGAYRMYVVRNSWYQVGCPCRAKCGWPTFIVRLVMCGSSGLAI